MNQKDEISLSLSSQRSIPLVVDIDGTSLSTLFDSKAYIACLQKTGQVSAQTRLDDAQTSDIEEENHKQKKHKEKKGKKRGREVFKADTAARNADNQRSPDRPRASVSRAQGPKPPPGPRFIDVSSSDGERDKPRDTPKPSNQENTQDRVAATAPLVDTSRSNRPVISSGQVIHVNSNSPPPHRQE